jgi:DNA-3-methyladenine glycosylase I
MAQSVGNVPRQVSRSRCPWCGDDPLYVKYHDEEWGRPVHDDHTLFEFITLEGAQAGLSWLIVLRKREHYQKVFASFDPAKVARFDAKKIKALLADPGIIRHRGKIESTIKNAQVFLKMQKEFCSFSSWLWARAKGHVSTLQKRPNTMAHIPTNSVLAEELSRELRKPGMRFVGPTILHSFLQAVGVLDEHLVSCWRAKAKPSK